MRGYGATEVQTGIPHCPWQSGYILPWVTQGKLQSSIIPSSCLPSTVVARAHTPDPLTLRVYLHAHTHAPTFKLRALMRHAREEQALLRQLVGAAADSRPPPVVAVPPAAGIHQPVTGGGAHSAVASVVASAPEDTVRYPCMGSASPQAHIASTHIHAHTQAPSVVVVHCEPLLKWEEATRCSLTAHPTSLIPLFCTASQYSHARPLVTLFCPQDPLAFRQPERFERDMAQWHAQTEAAMRAADAAIAAAVAGTEAPDDLRRAHATGQAG